MMCSCSLMPSCISDLSIIVFTGLVTHIADDLPMGNSIQKLKVTRSSLVFSQPTRKSQGVFSCDYDEPTLLHIPSCLDLAKYLPI